jgi:NADH-quinone oxidoreductase subunit N
MTLLDALTILPIILLIVWAMIVLLVDLWIPKAKKGWTALLSAIGMAAALVLTLLQANHPQSAFGGMLEVDGFSVFLNVIFLISGLAGVGIACDYLKRMEIPRG